MSEKENDNDLQNTVWPPPPTQGQAIAPSERRVSAQTVKMGWIGIALAVFGFGLPTAAFWPINNYEMDQNIDYAEGGGFVFIIFYACIIVAFQVAALRYGICAWEAATGKAAVGIAAAVLALAAIFLLMLFIIHPGSTSQETIWANPRLFVQGFSQNNHEQQA